MLLKNEFFIIVLQSEFFMNDFALRFSLFFAIYFSTLWQPIITPLQIFEPKKSKNTNFHFHFFFVRSNNYYLKNKRS